MIKGFFISLRPVQDSSFMPKSAFRWEVLPAKMRNRRDVLFSFADFIGAFGGAATLFLGVNVWRFAMIKLQIIENVTRFFYKKCLKR